MWGTEVDVSQLSPEHQHHDESQYVDGGGHRRETPGGRRPDVGDEPGGERTQDDDHRNGEAGAPAAARRPRVGRHPDAASSGDEDRADGRCNGQSEEFPHQRIRRPVPPCGEGPRCVEGRGEEAPDSGRRAPLRGHDHDHREDERHRDRGVPAWRGVVGERRWIDPETRARQDCLENLGDDRRAEDDNDHADREAHSSARKCDCADRHAAHEKRGGGQEHEDLTNIVALGRGKQASRVVDGVTEALAEGRADEEEVHGRGARDGGCRDQPQRLRPPRVGVVVGPQAASSAEAAAANIVSPTVESTATIVGIDTRSTHELRQRFRDESTERCVNGSREEHALCRTQVVRSDRASARTSNEIEGATAGGRSRRRDVHEGVDGERARDRGNPSGNPASVEVAIC